ncbi:MULTISPECIES: hypothetical protein [unclassified Microcoleus]|uniref:hypothetical protein n=1 Tax=unclassified Microcoleus TaxID=2642155 RepID=UPI002FD0363B
MKIELIDVYCRDTEDVTGADEFYLVGALAGGTVVKPILTKPISINDKQRKTFPAGESVLFEGEVPQGQSVKGGIKAYDEDAAKDWAQYGSVVSGISGAVSTVLSATGVGATAGMILGVVTKGVGFFSSLDKDDLLGTTELEISATGPSKEERSWLIQKLGGSGWSNWDYTLRYRISRS